MGDFVDEVFIRGVFEPFELEQSFDFVDESGRRVVVVRWIGNIYRYDPDLSVSQREI